MVKFEHNRLVISELFTDKNGKTNATKTAGFFACLVSLIVFIVCTITLLVVINVTAKYDGIDFTQILGVLQTLIMQAIGLFGIGATLLGINRLSKDTTITTGTNEQQENVE